jgi:hypothetical protein
VPAAKYVFTVNKPVIIKPIRVNQQTALADLLKEASTVKSSNEKTLKKIIGLTEIMSP